jgi:small subunit ribosomal protein S9
MAKTKTINKSGKRKMAVARATLKQGSGSVYINNIALDAYTPKMARQRIQEPLILAGAAVKKLDVSVTVNGGGVSGQADAVRLAIAKTLAEHDSSLKDVFLDYDRQLLVADVRRKETRKPNSHGKARAKRQKSYR